MGILKLNVGLDAALMLEKEAEQKVMQQYLLLLCGRGVNLLQKGIWGTLHGAAAPLVSALTCDLSPEGLDSLVMV